MSNNKDKKQVNKTSDKVVTKEKQDWVEKRAEELDVSEELIISTVLFW